MYNEDILLKKVEGHIKDNEKNILNGLIQDVKEFNSDYCNPEASVFIDFDNVGNDGDYDPYETFSLKLKRNNRESVIIDNMDLHELDIACAAIYGYFDEVSELLQPKLAGQAYQEKVTKLESEIHRLEDKLILKSIVK